MGIREELKERLSGLASAAGLVPGPRVDAFLDRFGPFLTHFMEYGLQFSSRSVAALSFGHGDLFHEALGAWLADDGVPAEDRARVEALRRQIDDWMVLKVDVVGPAPRRVGVYLRRPVPLATVASVLDDEGATDEARRAVDQIATLLDAPCAQILALVLAGTSAPGMPAAGAGNGPVGGPPAEPRQLKLYMGLGPQATNLLARVEGAFEVLGVPFGAARRYLEALGGVAAAREHGLLVSAFVAGGAVRPVAKLDVFGVDLEALERAVEAAGVRHEGLPTPRELGRLLDMQLVEHAGVSFGAAEDPTLNLYFPFER